MKFLKDKVKRFLDDTDVALTVICRKAGVTYGPVYRFKTKGGDLPSADMEKLVAYFEGNSNDEQG